VGAEVLRRTNSELLSQSTKSTFSVECEIAPQREWWRLKSPKMSDGEFKLLKKSLMLKPFGA